VKEYLTWVTTFLASKAPFRKQTVGRALDQLVEFGSGTGNFEQRKKQGKILYNLIKGSDWKLVGVMASVRYLKVDAPNDDLRAIHIHPLGSPGLLYYNKRLGTLVVVGTNIRFDDSVVNEFKENIPIGVGGLTG
jgi:hypothetical protein